MTLTQFKKLQRGDRVKYKGKNYKFVRYLYTRFYIGLIQAKGGNLIGIAEEDLKSLRRLK